MADHYQANARDLRLKSALRDNLRKRKLRARELDAPPEADGSASTTDAPQVQTKTARNTPS